MSVYAAEGDGLQPPKAGPHDDQPHAALTLEEESACHRIMDEALALGFPELAGAVVMRGIVTPGWGPHLHLADGSWLIDECIHRSADEIKQSECSIMPPDCEPYSFRHMDNLQPAERERMSHCLMRGSTFDSRDNLGLTALAWWRTGIDADGQSLIAVVLRNSTTSQDHGDVLSWPSEYGDGGGLGVTPLIGKAPDVDIPTGMRRIISSWFRAQLAQARSAADADRWAASAMAIITPADAALIKPLVERLRTRFDLPDSIDEHGTLADRMMQWPGTVYDPVGLRLVSAPPVPASRADTTDLIALISDDRASKWISATWVPRTVGDNALRALHELWNLDWSDLTINDPTVNPKVRDLSNSSIWTDQLRYATAASLTRWWQAHGNDGEWAPLCGCIRNQPAWTWWYQVMMFDQDHLPAVVGDCIAECLQTPLQLPEDGSIDPMYVYQQMTPLFLAFPAQPGITAFLRKLPQSRWTLGLLNIRAGLAGDDAGLQAWMLSNLAGSGAMYQDEEFQSGGAGDPWGNLGLLAYRPTVDHLTMLRTMLSWDLSCPGAVWVLAHVGTMNYPVLCESIPSHSSRDRPHANAIPLALTLIGLSDTRPLPEDIISWLVHWAPDNTGLYNPKMIQCESPRVCDWVASLLINDHYDQVFTGFVPAQLRDGKRFMEETVAQRDADIQHMQHALQPVVVQALSAVGLLEQIEGLHLPSGIKDF